MMRRARAKSRRERLAEASAELRRIEATQRACLDALEQGVVLSTLDGEVLVINDAAVQVLGYSAEEMTSRFREGRWQTYREDGSVLPPDQRPLGHTMATGEAVRDAVVGWRTKDDRFLVLRVATQPVWDAEGVMTGVVTAFTDVTTERRALMAERTATSAVAAAEDELRRSFEESLTGMVLIGLDGRIRRANPAYAAIVGRDITALLGTDAIDVSPVGEDEQVTARSVPTGALPDLETERRLVRPDGEVVWVRAHTSAVRDRRREITHFVSQVHDITEAREAEEALRETQARFAALIEQSSDIICLLEASGRILYASPAAERILGYDLAEGADPRFLELIHPDDVPAASEAYDELLRHPGVARAAQLRLMGRDGVWRDMEVVATNRLDDTDVRGVVANVRDITERAQEAARLTWQAYHDVLTGLANRALLQDRLDHALERSRRAPELTGLLFIDLDHFKAVNDDLGHDAGDRLLIEVADRLLHAVRTGDTVARLGGDEFVVLAEALTLRAEATVIAARVLELLAAPVHLDGVDVTIRASVGIAFDEIHNPDLLLRDADAALYQAKRAGGGCYVVYGPQLESPSDEPVRLSDR
jgi:diguanylate cyclase (GGDEF)-like protein/PAS domain S-box-containing protein